jgi:hypothetical protein
MFLSEFPGVEPLTRQEIGKLRVNIRSEQTGSVSGLRTSGRPRTAVTDENLQTVAEALVASSVKSTRRAPSELGIAGTSLQRILLTS